jgi:hypothetical protein
MWKIGLRIFGAKVGFPRFMYCFGRFSALTQNLSASRSQQVHYILKKGSNPVVLFEIGVVVCKTLQQIRCPW